MQHTMRHTLLVLLLAAMSCVPSMAQNRIDTIRADAPELAAYGSHTIGVRTLTFVNPNQIDVLAIDPGLPEPDPLPRYDRPITVEIWYPAEKDANGSHILKTTMRDGKREIEFIGKAVRDAAPEGNAMYPLVIVSHGFPGNRFLLSPLAENIASKGYVVVSIDHTDSTYATYQNRMSFTSTLVNRPLDQLFVLNQIAKLSTDSKSFLYGIVDANNTAIVGYSMGAYGATISAGAGITQKGAASVPFSLLDIWMSGSASRKAMLDQRIKTIVTFGVPLMNGLFDADSITTIGIPMLLIGGSVDDVAGYEQSIRPLWKAATSVDRALLTFENANHNAGAPMPPPQEDNRFDEKLNMNLANHYIDAVWDNVRMNNVSEHFVTAWLNKYLKSDPAMDAYLDLIPASNDGVWAVNKDGTFKPEHSYWKGFPNRTAKGLRFETLKAGE